MSTKLTGNCKKCSRSLTRTWHTWHTKTTLQYRKVICRKKVSHTVYTNRPYNPHQKIEKNLQDIFAELFYTAFQICFMIAQTIAFKERYYFVDDKRKNIKIIPYETANFATEDRLLKLIIFQRFVRACVLSLWTWCIFCWWSHSPLWRDHGTFRN